MLSTIKLSWGLGSTRLYAMVGIIVKYTLKGCLFLSRLEAFRCVVSGLALVLFLTRPGIFSRAVGMALSAEIPTAISETVEGAIALMSPISRRSSSRTTSVRSDALGIFRSEE